MKTIDGNKLADQILLTVKNKISNTSKIPRLEIFSIADDFASNVYVNKKKEAGEKIGIEVNINSFSDDVQEKEIIDLIDDYNKNNNVTGIMIQFPISRKFDIERLVETINPEKDVDGLTRYSLANSWYSTDTSKGFISATPLAVMECLRYIASYEDGIYSVKELDKKFQSKNLAKYLAGKNVCVINRSNIVGKPLAGLLTNLGATVTICNSKTKDLKLITKNSNIIISGTGKSGLINKDFIPYNATLIDIGINNTAKGIGGDIDPTGADEKISWLTPVPGGVGPLTVAMLMKNLVTNL